MKLTSPGRKRSKPPAHAEALEGRAYFAVVAFQPVTLLPAGQYPSGLAVADLTGSGIEDIVDTNYGDGTVGVFMGHGDGTFAPMVTYPVGNGPESVVIADVNGDGIPDLIVANSGTNTLDPANTNSNTVSVLLGRGDGTFAPAMNFAVGQGPDAVVVADFNGDGKPDIATANLLDNTITVLNGNGDGTFGLPVAYAVGDKPQGLSVADFNRDGHPDLVTANSDSDTVAVLLNAGDGTFKPRIGYDVGDYPRAVIGVDLTGKGKPSIVATNLEDATFSILHGVGNGTFDTQATFVTGVNPFGIAAGDLNDDGYVDLVTANGNGTVSVRQRHATGYTTDRTIFATGAGPQNVAIADLNNDGKPDLITSDFGDDTIGILLNDTPRPDEKSTTTRLVTTPNPALLDQPVTLTAVVRSALGKPSGPVAFYDNGVSIGTADVSAAGYADFTDAALSGGVNTLTTQYLGAAGFAESVSKPVVQVVTTSTSSGPDLVATFDATSLASQFVPGESASATFRITNQGDARANGTLDDTLYLSPDGLLDDATQLSITGNLASSTIALKPGQSTALTANFTVPAGIAPGEYALVADANANGLLTETNLSDNVGASPVAYQAVNEFGDVGGISNVTLTLADSAGTPVTFRLTGTGTGVVAATPNGLDVSITGTTTASTLTIATPTGSPAATLDTLTDDSAIGAVQATAANFTGPVNLDGGATTVALNNLTGTATDTSGLNLGGGVVKSIALGSVSDASMSALAGIRTLSVAGWSDTAQDRITAGFIGKLASAAAFGPVVQLTGAGAPHGVSLASATVDGFDGSLSAAGRVTRFVDTADFSGVLAAARFGSIVIDGSLTGDILAGANLGGDAVLGGGDDTFGVGVIQSVTVVGTTSDAIVAAGLSPVNDVLLDGDDVLLPGGRIGSITLGPTDTNSRFLAANLPATAAIQGQPVGTARDPRFQL